MMMKWISLVAGSSLGGAARYLLSGAAYRVFGTAFPHGTLLVNLAGCFLIGFLAVLSDQKFLLGPNQRMLLMVGFCGAFTTFSTFIYESAQLIAAGETLRAFLNVMGSVALGFLVFRLGVFAGELL